MTAREVEHLLHRYAEAVDAGDFAAVGELFRHGRICAASEDGPVVVADGADAVTGLYDSLVIRYDDGTPRTRHLVSNAIIEVDEALGSATSRSSYTVFQATDGPAGARIDPIVIGRYDDTFHRLGGTWWFASRTMHIDLAGDLSRHLRS